MWQSDLVTVDRIPDDFRRERFVIALLDGPAVLAYVQVLHVRHVRVDVLQALLQLLLVACDHVDLNIKVFNVDKNDFDKNLIRSSVCILGKPCLA